MKRTKKFGLVAGSIILSTALLESVAGPASAINIKAAATAPIVKCRTVKVCAKNYASYIHGWGAGVNKKVPAGGWSTSGKSIYVYWNQASGHNCTNYAAFVENKAFHVGTESKPPGRNAAPKYLYPSSADNWGLTMAPYTTTTPSVGDVAWWKISPYGNGSGHVAIVEWISSDGTSILVSEDNYNRRNFKLVNGVKYYDHLGADAFRVMKFYKNNPKIWPTKFIHFQ